MAKTFFSMIVTGSLWLLLANGASAQETKAPQFSPYHSQSHKATKHRSYGKSKSSKTSGFEDVCEEDCDDWNKPNQSTFQYEDCEDEECDGEAYKGDCDEGQGDCYPQKGSSKYENCKDEDDCYDER